MTVSFYAESINRYTNQALESIDYLTGLNPRSVRSTVDDAFGKITATIHIAGYDTEVKWDEYKRLEQHADKQRKRILHAMEEVLL